MKPCEQEWSLVVASKSGEEEEARARAFSQCAREHRLVYTLKLRDPGTGAELPIADLDKHAGAIGVQLLVEDGGKATVLSFKARSPASVYPLLAE